jgi:hypothetical protein
VTDQAKCKCVLAGHVGQNPPTREGALQEIEKFKANVAKATIKGE